jgi:hypothetical protein
MRNALLLALGCLAACIERPETPRMRAAEVDRARLADVLLSSAPSPRYPVGAEWGERIELVGVDVTPDPVPRGGQVTVTAYYRVLDEVADDWKIFVHVDDEGKGGVRVNADHWPAEDRFRTAGWRKGDVVKDTYKVTVPATAADRLELWTGFYQDNDRLDVSSAGRGLHDGQNRVRIAILTVR